MSARVGAQGKLACQFRDVGTVQFNLLWIRQMTFQARERTLTCQAESPTEDVAVAVPMRASKPTETLAFAMCRWLAVATCASALAVAGCGTASESEQLATAKIMVEKGDFDAASVQLKALIQHFPSSAQARLMLGTVLMDIGDLEAAEIELRKALSLKDTQLSATPTLARLLLKRGQYAKIVSEYSDIQLNDAVANADLKTSLASAHAYLNQDAKANALVDAVLRANAQYVPAQLLRARLTAGNGDVDGALRTLQALRQREPKNVEVLLVDGYLKLHGKHNLEGAVESYRNVLAIDPKEVRAHILLVNAYHAAGNADALAKQIDEIKKALPNHPQTRLYEARLAFMKGNHKEALDKARELLRFSPDHVELLTLAGAAELRLNSTLQAERDLSKALTSAPKLLTARLLLGETLVRMGQAENALQTLEPLIGVNGANWKALQLAAEARLQMGDIQTADTLFRQAAKSHPDDPLLRTSVALTDLAKGRSDLAFKELESVAASDKGTVADLALVTARMRRGELVEAMKVIDILEKKLPGSATPSLLRAQAGLLKSDFPAARVQFEKALLLEPVNSSALTGLELLDLRDAKPEAALKRYADVLEKNPGHLQALLGSANLKAKQGASKEQVGKILAEAVRTNPNNPLPHVELVRHHLAHNDAKSAVAAGQAGVAVLPESPAVLDALAQSQVAAGEHRQAVITFAKIIPLISKSPTPHFRVAQTYLQINEYEPALLSLKRALEIAPDFLEAQNLLVVAALRAGKYQDALNVARSVQKQRPDQAVGFLFEGNIAMERKEWETAIVAYRNGLNKANVGILPSRLHFALLAARKSEDADRFASEWNRTHPKDTMLPIYLGDLAMARKDWKAAERQYSDVLARDANNTLALNNVAWLRVVQDKPGAIRFAERAVALAPHSAAAQDTLSQAAIADGQFDRAILAAKTAVSLEPNSPRFRLGLAKALLRAGKVAEAKPELEQLKAMGAKFEGAAEVASLLK